MVNKFKIGFITTLLVLMIVIGLSSCTSIPAAAEQDYRIKLVTKSWVRKDGYNQFYDIICDEETGVEYLVVGNDHITPLYNADGSLKIKGE